MRHITISRLLARQQRDVVLHRDQRRRRAPPSAAPWRSTAARSGCSPGGCSARRPARSSWRAERRGCSRPCRRGVEEVPQLRPLVLGIPLAERVAEGVDALLGARLLLVAPRAAEGRVEAAFRQRVEQRARLQQPAALLRPQPERVGAIVDRLAVGMDDQLGADLAREPVAELDHLAELVGGVDVQQRERNLARIETPSAPAAPSPTSPCRSSTASPAARTPPPPRAGCGCSRLRARADVLRSAVSTVIEIIGYQIIMPKSIGIMVIAACALHPLARKTFPRPASART